MSAKLSKEKLQQLGGAMACAVGKATPPGYGFVITLFDLEEDGDVFLRTNIETGDCADMLEAIAKFIRAGGEASMQEIEAERVD